jgi:hypothetical protein
MIFFVFIIIIVILAIAVQVSRQRPNVVKIDGPYKPRRSYIIHPTEFRRNKYVIPVKTNTSKVSFNEVVKVREFNSAGTRDLETKINDYECQQ